MRYFTIPCTFCTAEGRIASYERASSQGQKVLASCWAHQTVSVFYWIIDLGLEDALSQDLRCVLIEIFISYFSSGKLNGNLFSKILLSEGHDANHCAIVVSDVRPASRNYWASLGQRTVVVLAPKEKGLCAVEGGFKPGGLPGLARTLESDILSGV